MVTEGVKPRPSFSLDVSLIIAERNRTHSRGETQCQPGGGESGRRPRGDADDDSAHRQSHAKGHL